MRRMSYRNHKKTGTRKVVTGLLLGSVVGATVGWLTAPASGPEMLRRLTGRQMSARERVKTAEGNVESQVRELAAQVSPSIETPEQTATAPRKRVTPPQS